MYSIRKVGNWRSGMGLKVVKFHAITHMADDINNFGVPKTFNTESDKSAHKPAKVVAKVTKKRKDMFDLQVAKRLTEVHALELAIEEICSDRLLWDYEHFYDDPDTPQMLNHSKARNGEPGGTCYTVHLDNGVNRLFIRSGYVKGYEKAVIPDCDPVDANPRNKQLDVSEGDACDKN
jgi:hypothetical protein